MEQTCSLCVFGHRKIFFDEKRETELYLLLEKYITEKNVGVFYFGGFGEFDFLCHKIITNLKEKYPFIKRVYVFEDYKYVSRPNKRPKWLNGYDYDAFEYFESDYIGFYKRIYFRNCEIIKHSDFCVFYVDETRENSGSNKALNFAKRKKKNYVNIY